MSSRFRILALDDSLTIRKLVELACRRRKYVLDLAEDGATGIELALASPPDLILLDFILPDMLGTDVVTALAESPATRDVPIVVMSAKGTDVVSLFESHRGVRGFLHKPFTPAGLVEAVEKVHRMVQSGHGAKPRASSRPSRTGTHGLTRTLYGIFKKALARLPGWESRRGEKDPAQYFGRLLLTSERVQAILRSCEQVAADTGASERTALTVLTDNRLLERVSEFSQKVQGKQLSTDTRRLLAQVAGRNTGAELRQRTGMDIVAYGHALSEAIRHGLLGLHESESMSTASSAPRHSALIVDPDPHVRRALGEELISGLRPLLPTFLDRPGDMDTQFPNGLPLAVLMADPGGGELDATVASLRERAPIGTLRLVAMMDPDAGGAASEREVELARLGFDAVLKKPFTREALRAALGEDAPPASPSGDPSTPKP